MSSMTDHPEHNRLPLGVRQLSDESVWRIHRAGELCKHKRLAALVIPMMVSEACRRHRPGEVTAPWPAVDTSGWSDAELFHALQELAAWLVALPDSDARHFTLQLHAGVWWGLKQRIGAERLSDVDVYATGGES